MRVSYGQHCEGRDRSAKNRSAETAEDGLFQVSFNSIGMHPLLKPLFAQFRGRDDLLSEFRVGVRCSDENLNSWGDGEGYDFQALTKNCPHFSSLCRHSAAAISQALGTYQ